VNSFTTELRAEITGDKLQGFAHVFGTVAKVGQTLERMQEGCFTRSLASGQEIIATHQHNRALLLGTTASGSLRVSQDSQGLSFEIDKLPNTTAGRDVRELMERGDLRSCSFAFLEGQVANTRANGTLLRTHTDISRLVDVSVVAQPAYPGTEAYLRAEELLEEEELDLKTQLILIRQKIRSI